MPPVAAKCRVTAETTNLPGNFVRTVYTYNTVHKTALAEFFYSNGVSLGSKTISYVTDELVSETNHTNYNGNKVTIKYHYPNGRSLPDKAERYFDGGNNFSLGGYDFHYDAKDKLVKVVQGTPQPNDWEYTLHITYNNNDNVVKLEYEVTTGPRTTTVITVDAYDDKPNIYSGDKNRKFIMNALWDNYDPEPILTALSKNNPLDYTHNGNFKRKMEYTYNDKGFPLTRTNTNTNSSGTVTYVDTFEYECN